MLRCRWRELRERFLRARYFRGHGVHSPYVYAIVREVFMRRELMEGDRSLYDAMIALGLPHRRAVQLQNLAIHCGYKTFAVDSAGADICILTRRLSRTESLAAVRRARQEGRTVVLLAPYAGQERMMMCRQVVAEHPCTTVDNRAYILIFSNNLPKQHYRI